MGRPANRPIFTPGDGARIVRDTADKKRPRDGIDDARDQLLELDALTAKLVRGRRVNLQIPIIDPVQLDRAILFLIEELPGLRARLKAIPDRKAKTLLAQSELTKWSQAFSRLAGVSNAPKPRHRRKNARQRPPSAAIVSADASAELE